jgi:hypothetical protein
MNLQQTNLHANVWTPLVNIAFGVVFLAILIAWFRITSKFTVDDDFMRRAKYWMTFGILLRASLCLGLGIIQAVNKINISSFLGISSTLMFLLGSLPLCCITVVITAIVFSIFQMEIALKELQSVG